MGATGRILYYASEQFTGFHSITIPGTIRDSMFILNGLLEQETGLRPQELISDNAGYSDLMFGLFRLLGYRFSPRVADIGGTRLWRFDRAANYGVLDGVSDNILSSKLIETQWDDVLRVTASLHLRRVKPSDLVRVLQGDGRATKVAQAISEIGRCQKTVHLLSYVDDPLYRRRMKVGSNHIESRNGLGRRLCSARKGEIRQQYREGQEDQLGALGLVLNAIVVWNTRYMEAALQHLRERGEEVRPEDVAHLSPLGFEHINLAGKYLFRLPDAVRGGALRPFRSSTDIDF